ncbi:MAG: hypothetical protein GY754_24785 [bacterium]|nr:hypothetical protein [bacterium]
MNNEPKKINQESSVTILENFGCSSITVKSEKKSSEEKTESFFTRIQMRIHKWLKKDGR